MDKNYFIYFIQAESGGLVKIGFSNDPETRLDTLQMSSPVRLQILATRYGGKAEEKKLHKQFKRSRVYGEWFRPVPTLMAIVASLQGQEHKTAMAWAQLDGYMARRGSVMSIDADGYRSYTPPTVANLVPTPLSM